MPGGSIHTSTNLLTLYPICRTMCFNYIQTCFIIKTHASVLVTVREEPVVDKYDRRDVQRVRNTPSWCLVAKSRGDSRTHQATVLHFIAIDELAILCQCSLVLSPAIDSNKILNEAQQNQPAHASHPRSYHLL